jgi:beta-lactamase class A
MNPEREIRALRERLREGGLAGSFLVRDLNSGEEIGIDPDLAYPIASLVKVPLAIAVLSRIANGELDEAQPIDIAPGRVDLAGPAGLSRFRYPARVAVADLLYLSIAISDNAAADALFALVPPAEVNRTLRDYGLSGIVVRHLMGDLMDTPAERFAPGETHLAHSLAIGARTATRGHPVRQLDISLANSGSARSFVDLLREVWTPQRIPAEVAARVRELMADNLIRHRLAPDFASDAARWSSKTGTLLNLRHEAGVVEYEDGSRFAVAALTESRVPAVLQPAAEALLARVARTLHDLLREG